VKTKGDCTAGVVKEGDRPYMHYRGYLADGTQFDSSYDRGTPLSFPAGHQFVIKCWDDAVIGMCVGEEARLLCPPEMAYGDRGAGDVIPPGATLTFDVKLVKIGDIEDA
jgi:FKBP-type peptidyl-prolyl cis-trans isomerase